MISPNCPGSSQNITFESIYPLFFASPGNLYKLMVSVCFPCRMKRTAFLLVFGVVLSFCLAQVSPVLKSDKSLKATHVHLQT